MFICKDCQHESEKGKHCSECGGELEVKEEEKKVAQVKAEPSIEGVNNKIDQLIDVIQAKDAVNDKDDLKGHLGDAVNDREALIKAQRKSKFDIQDQADIGKDERGLQKDIADQSVILEACRIAEGFFCADALGHVKGSYVPVKMEDSIMFKEKFGMVKPDAMNRAMKGLSSGVLMQESMKLYMKERRIKQAMDTVDTSVVVPVVASSLLFKTVREQNVILANTRIRQMTVQSETDLLEGNDQTWYYITENTGDTGQHEIGATNVPPTNITFALRKTGARTLLSYELLESAIINMESYVNEKLLVSANENLEYLIFRGDEAEGANANINLNNGTPTTTAGTASRYLTTDGWDKQCIDGSGGHNSAMGSVTKAKIVAMLKDLGKYAADRNKAAFFVNTEGYFLLIETLTDYQTLDKVGSRATLLTGQLDILFGYPLFVSGQRINTETSQGGELIASPVAQLPAITLAYLPGAVTAFAASGILMEPYVRPEFQQRGFITTVRMDTQQVYGVDMLSLRTDMTA